MSKTPLQEFLELNRRLNDLEKEFHDSIAALRHKNNQRLFAAQRLCEHKFIGDYCSLCEAYKNG